MRAAGPGSAEIALRRYFSASRQVEEVSQVPPGLVRTAIGHDGEPTDAAEAAFSRIETAVSEESREVVIETISAVTTRTGLKVQAVLDTNSYPRGIRLSDWEMREFEARHLQRHDFHGDWNYTITAETATKTTRPGEQG